MFNVTSCCLYLSSKNLFMNIDCISASMLLSIKHYLFFSHRIYRAFELTIKRYQFKCRTASDLQSCIP